MKRYLNKEDRYNTIILGTLVDFMNNLIIKFEELKRPKSVIKFMKMSRSFCLKVIDWYFQNLDDKYKHDVINEMKKLEIIVKQKTEAIREFKEMEKIESNMVVVTEDFYEICEYALLVCMKCKAGKEQIAECKLKEAMIRNNVPVMHLEISDDGCPYKYNQEVL